MRVVAQPGQDLGQFGREEIPGVHRDELPQFHGGAAQMRQAVGDLADIGGRQQHVAQLGALAVGQAANAFSHHSAGDRPRQAAELPQPR